MLFAPVLFTLSVTLDAVLVTVNFTMTIEPVFNVQLVFPLMVITFVATSAAVEQVPYAILVLSNFVLSAEDINQMFQNTIDIGNACEEYTLKRSLEIPYMPKDEYDEELRYELNIDKTKYPYFYTGYKNSYNTLDLELINSKFENTGYKFRMLRIYTGMNRKDFAEWLHIPYRTMTEWERGTRQMPEYLFELIAYKVMNEKGKGNI